VLRLPFACHVGLQNLTGASFEPKLQTPEVVPVGGRLELRCLPPHGVPAPVQRKVLLLLSWPDGRRIDRRCSRKRALRLKKRRKSRFGSRKRKKTYKRRNLCTVRDHILLKNKTIYIFKIRLGLKCLYVVYTEENMYTCSCLYERACW